MRNQAEAEEVLAATKQYAAAYADYQRCLRALIQVARSGERRIGELETARMILHDYIGEVSVVEDADGAYGLVRVSNAAGV